MKKETVELNIWLVWIFVVILGGIIFLQSEDIDLLKSDMKYNNYQVDKLITLNESYLELVDYCNHQFSGHLFRTNRTIYMCN